MEKDKFVFVIKKDDEGWWECESEDGRKGMFPDNFLVAATYDML